MFAVYKVEIVRQLGKWGVNRSEKVPTITILFKWSSSVHDDLLVDSGLFVEREKKKKVVLSALIKSLPSGCWDFVKPQQYDFGKPQRL